MLADGEFQYYVVVHAFNPELRQQRQADLRSRPGLYSAFQAIQSYTERPCFNKTDADVGNERPRQKHNVFPDWEDPNGEAQCRCDEEDSGERRLTHSQQVFLQTGEKANSSHFGQRSGSLRVLVQACHLAPRVLRQEDHSKLQVSYRMKPVSKF